MAGASGVADHDAVLLNLTGAQLELLATSDAAVVGVRDGDESAACASVLATAQRRHLDTTLVALPTRADVASAAARAAWRERVCDPAQPAASLCALGRAHDADLHIFMPDATRLNARGAVLVATLVALRRGVPAAALSAERVALHFAPRANIDEVLAQQLVQIAVQCHAQPQLEW